MTSNGNVDTIHFFEGVEKLLEIWFSLPEDKEADLRTINRSEWIELLRLVKCEVISFSKNDHIDAYVLSESSMFVSKRRWILKTCGTTTPLVCMENLLNIVANVGFKEISDLFYSRKNFSRPELQVFPHRGFCEETEYLDSLFPEGRSYCLGTINRECWYLYTFSKRGNLYTQAMDESQLNPDADQTIEILMQDLDETKMRSFWKDECQTGKEATQKAGIDNILPNMRIDDYLFDPCGYSMNGISPDGEYMTIHITPESQCSYVSFESNVAMDNYAELINRVIGAFSPKQFIVTIFANKSSGAYETLKKLEMEYSQMGRWSCSNLQCSTFPSYNLLFARYTLNSRSLLDGYQN